MDMWCEWKYHHVSTHSVSPHARLNESVRFSMLHWPQQYCKPLHITVPERPIQQQKEPSPSKPRAQTRPACSGHVPPTASSSSVCLLACFKGFCLHRQKSREDNFLEFGLAGPFWRYARCGSHFLSLSLWEGQYLSRFIYPEDLR